jgi:muramoyltetrapeptide carboxypeptidase
MLVQLKAAGKFRDCAGIILGYYTNCGAKQPENSLTMEQVFDELIVPEQKPTVMDFACGHSLPSLSLPLGKEVKLNSNCGSITVID